MQTDVLVDTTSIKVLKTKQNMLSMFHSKMGPRVVEMHTNLAATWRRYFRTCAACDKNLEKCKKKCEKKIRSKSASKFITMSIPKK